MSIISQKKRKITRACDGCKRRKVRIQPIPPDNKCSFCAATGADCAYTVDQKKRGRAKGYVEGLERRIRLLEGLVKKLLCGTSNQYTRLNPIPTSRSCMISTTATTPSSEKEPSDPVLDLIQKIASISLGSQDATFRDDDDDHVALSKQVKFFGKSSGAMLVQVAVSLKNEYSKGTSIKRRMLESRRPIFWRRFSWEKGFTCATTKYTFPSPDLIAILTDAYFVHVNLLLPLLHRPTFERDVANGLHLNDEGFGGVLLLVCAVGSRYTEQIDERTWFNQVQIVKQSLLDPLTLYNLQSYCLAAEFMKGSHHAPQAEWILTGFGIRLAQDVGAIRLTVEDELWKRAFWVLVAMDRVISMGIGRPCAIFDDHLDVDMPVECDDEYWEHPDPTQRFKQPNGVPSTVTAFNQHLQLYKVMAFAMSTIYSLDSALNNWMSSLPDYLRWDPNRSDDRFFKLSGSLITTFYYVQMIIHRPYSAVNKQPTSLSLPSIAICTSAARSCSLVLEQQMKLIAFKTGLVLLFNIWGSKRSGSPTDPISMRQVEKCMDFIRKAEARCRSAGMLSDILNELTTAGELVLPSEDNFKLSTMQSSTLNAGSPSEGSTLRSGDSSISSSSQLAGLFSTDVYTSERFNPGLDDQLYSFAHGGMGTTAGPEIGHEISNQPSHEHVSARYMPYHNPSTGISDAFSFEHFDSNSNMYVPVPQQEAIVDGNAVEMHLNAPSGFELNEWISFLASFT
ncbi:fungal-specific transcription factor domain-containing protein [Cyathus striatus]|nr:fungal-specific transcription factor domain-containing protein [Cyathus striatus]